MLGDDVRRIFGRNAPVLWQRTVLFGVAYYLCAALGGYLSPRQGTVVTFWLPAGLYVAVLLLEEVEHWPWLALAAFSANFAFDGIKGTKFGAILGFFCANTVGAMFGAWLVRRFVSPRPTLATVGEFAGLLLMTSGLSMVPAAAIGAGTLVLSGYSQSFWRSFAVWWGSDAMAIFLLAPFLLVWLGNAHPPRREPRSPKRIFEAILLFGGLAAYTWYILVIDEGIAAPYKSRLLPFLLWAGLRFGLRGATAASLLLSLLMAFCTTQYLKGLAPTEISSEEYVFTLQSFLVVAALVGVIPAIALDERDRSTDKLRESEEHYRSLTEAAFEGISISEHGHIVNMNEQGLRMFGYSRAEMLGKPIVELVAPESREIVAEAVRTGRESSYEHRLLRKDGSFFIGEAQARIVHVGEHTFRMTALRDITERRRAEELTRTQMRVLELLAGGKPLVETLDTLLRMIESQSPAMLCSILLLEPDGVHVRHGAAPSLPMEYIKSIDGQEIGPCAGSCGTAAFRREPVFVADIATDPLWVDYRHQALAHGLRACWSTPILDSQQRVVGTFAIYYREPGLPKAEHFQLIAMTTHTAAVCIAKHQTDLALRESEERFRAVVEFSPDCVAVAVGGHLVYVNPAGAKMMGANSPAELLGRNLYDFIPAEFHEITRQRRDQIMLRGEVAPPMEFPLLRLDGTTIYAEAQGVPFVFTGQPAILNLVHDVTDRKRAETERTQAVAREHKAREEFTRLLIASQEAERQRLAGELHDSLGQNLSIIKNRAHLARQVPGIAPAAESHLEGIERVVSEAIAETRNLAHNLRPLHIGQIGLADSVRELIREVSQSTNIRFERRVEDVDGVFSGDAATNVYRIVQEALNNLVKHSQAHSAVVTLERDLHAVRLRVVDDGVGFDPAQAEARGGLGLTSISERARMLGGTLQIKSAPGKGVELTVELPIAEEDSVVKK